MTAKFVYLLCAVTSLGCAGLLLKGYCRNKTRLLMWSSLCFIFLGLNNVLLFVDLALIPPTTDLFLYRNLLSFTGITLLLFGLTWEGA